MTENPSYICLVHSAKKMIHATKLTEQWAMEYGTKTINMPPMDENQNILDTGHRWCDAFVPRLYLIYPSQLRWRILVCQENPTIKLLIARFQSTVGTNTQTKGNNRKADDAIDAEPSVAGHSTNIVYV